MKILLYEYFTGSMPKVLPPVHLLTEGDRMLHALAWDLQNIAQTELRLIRDCRLQPVDFPATVTLLQAGDDYLAVLEEELNSCDAFLPIAPETNATLLCLCQLAERKDCVLLGSASHAVAVTASKLRTADTLRQAGVRCIETVPWEKEMSVHDIPCAFPVILKPDDGIGCEGQRIVETPRQLMQLVDADDSLHMSELYAPLQDTPRYVVQPYLPGQAASLSIVYHPRQAHLLAANIQRITRRAGTVSLHHCEINQLDRDGLHLEQMVQDVYSAVPGLAGYVGIDFLLYQEAPLILEINPRLTLSYIGLSAAIKANPAALILSLMQLAG